MPGVEQKKKYISPLERAQKFAQLTRKYWQPLPAQPLVAPGTIQFTLTKSRLLSKIYLLVNARVVVSHPANTDFTPDPFSPYNLIRNVRVEYNNGFTPFNLSGKQLAMYNLMRNNAEAFKNIDGMTAANGSISRHRTLFTETASVGGTQNILRMMPELPISINERDPISLFLLQNDDIVVTVTVEFNDIVTMVPQAGYVVTLAANATVQPVIETYSIPPIEEAFPDLGMIKLVSAMSEPLALGETKTLKLRPGNIFRKLAVYIEDGLGDGWPDWNQSGDFELIFNESDIPVKIPHWLLAGINQEMYGVTLPNGLWVFDFTYQGLANYGGGRDYIDTEKLTEFWLRFPASTAGTVTTLQETLTRLK